MDIPLSLLWLVESCLVPTNLLFSTFLISPRLRRVSMVLFSRLRTAHSHLLQVLILFWSFLSYSTVFLNVIIYRACRHCCHHWCQRGIHWCWYCSLSGIHAQKVFFHHSLILKIEISPYTFLFYFSLLIIVSREGMERSDLLKANAAIFKVQGKALNDYSSKDVKVKEGREKRERKKRKEYELRKEIYKGRNRKLIN